MDKAFDKNLQPELDPLADLFSFSRDILGYDQLTGLHLDWFQALLENQFMMLLAPRGHLKSTCVTTCFPLWKLTKNPNLRILIIAETQGIARKLLDAIKQHIVLNEKFKERFGSWDMAAAKWTEDSITIPRSRVLKEPSIACAGVLTNLVSLHCDLVILDDAVSNNNSYTHGQRTKLADWFTSVVLPSLEPHAQLFVVGTRWNAADLYSNILSSPGFEHWKKIALQAEWRDQSGTRRILFPERFSEKKLDEMKKMMGHASYSLQMLNFIPAEQTVFRPEWLRSCRYTEKPDDMNVFIGIDLAAGTKDSQSKFAYVVLGIPKGDKDSYVLEAYKANLQFPEQVKTIKLLCHVWKPNLVLVEDNAYQTSLLQVLRVDRVAARLPIKGITTTGEKKRRISSLAVLFENGAIRLPDHVTDLIDELNSFPSDQNDLLDALYLALQSVHEHRTEARIFFVGED